MEVRIRWVPITAIISMKYQHELRGLNDGSQLAAMSGWSLSPKFAIQGGCRSFLHDAAIVALAKVVFDFGLDRGRQSAL